MSTRELRRRFRHDRHLCAACRERKAKFQYGGHVRADREHVLCFQCYRAERERQRARQLVLPMFARPAVVFDQLTPSEIQHRQRMLAYLESQKVGEFAGQR